MATTKTLSGRRGTFRVETGTSDSGSITYATRGISNMNPAVSDDNMYDILAALGDLQTLPVDSIGYVDTVSLTRS